MATHLDSLGIGDQVLRSDAVFREIATAAVCGNVGQYRFSADA